MIHALPVGMADTFKEYGENVFIPHITNELKYAKRLDVVWDSYPVDSLKAETRDKRGMGLRRKVTATTKIPSKGFDFLQDGDNKTELFAFLSNKIAGHVFPDGKEVYATEGQCNGFC
jgi:hypothetical protein